MTNEDYIKRVTILGQYCYPERGEATVLIVFSCLKKTLAEESNLIVTDLLPEPVKSLWKGASINGRVNDKDCITLAIEIGNYPYRAAAERAFEIVFASIREIIDDKEKIKILELLPLYLKAIFERSRSCALDWSAEDFL